MGISWKVCRDSEILVWIMLSVGFLAAFYATVSASYAIEQDGLPRLGSTSNGEETWNGDLPLSRLKKLKARRRICV